MVLRALDSSFARGELSPLIHARPDLTMFQVGLARCENFIVMPQGGVTRRGGWTRREDLGRWTGNTCPARLIPFIYSTDDSHVIVMENGSAKAISAINHSVKGISNYPYNLSQATQVKYVQSGNEVFMAQADVPPQRLVRSGSGGSLTFEFKKLEYRNGPWYSAEKRQGKVRIKRGGTWGYQLESDTSFFSQSDVGKLFEINYEIAQNQVSANSGSGTTYSDAIEVGSEWYFRTTGSWTGTITLQRLPAGKDKDVESDWQDWRPHRRDNANEVGNAELSGSEDELNILYRIKFQVTNGGGFASITASGFTKTNTFEIKAYQSNRLVDAQWIKEFDDLDEIPLYGEAYTSDWRIGAWGGDNKYPCAIAFYQDRLCLAGTNTQAQGLWMSQTGDYQNFGTTPGNLKDDDAIAINLAAEDVSGIHSLYSGTDLMCFTSSSEWRIKGSGDNGAITPTAITAHKQTNIGSAPIQPFDAGGAVIMAQTHRNEVHTLKYAFEVDGYSGSNLSILSEHLFRKGKEIIDMAYQQIPDSQIWAVLADGTAACCTFEQEHQVFAWTRHVTNGRIGSICVVPHHSGHSQVWAVIQRGGVWAIEILNDRRTDTTFRDASNHFRSTMSTLRFPPSSEHFRAKKLIGRVAIYASKSDDCRIASVNDAKDEKWRWVKFPAPLGNDSEYEMVEKDEMLDSGFDRHSGVKIWTEGAARLTILAISPELTVTE